jgi:hypothetical protein
MTCSVFAALKVNVDLDPSETLEEYWDAIVMQTALGWDNFLMGCWSVEWVNQLRKEEAERTIPRSPERVIASIIARLWEISWDLWLGRNAAVYPTSEVAADGEITERAFLPARLCRSERRKKHVGVGRSQSLMRQWLSRASTGVSV